MMRRRSFETSSLSIRATRSRLSISVTSRVAIRASRPVQELLSDWYRENGRDLPWRKTRDPYAILVSEVMLQQTQVERVAPRWTAWLERWPSAEALAAAPLRRGVLAPAGRAYN